MTQASGNILLGDLQKRGARMTKTRVAVVELLAEGKPLSASQLLDRLAQMNMKVNKTTVYRELDFLMEHKCVREIDFLNGRKHYEILQNDHHHHLVCNSCSSVSCVEMHGDLEELEKKIQKKHKFVIQSHVLEFFGLCEDCRRGSQTR